MYYKTPDTPVYAQTITNGIPVYNSGGSTELELDEEYHIDVIRKLLEYMNIPMTNEQILNYLQQKKVEET